jgi:hypothetical protein
MKKNEHNSRLLLFYLGYIPPKEKQYLGLDRWGISDLISIIQGSLHQIPEDYYALVSEYEDKYLGKIPNELLASDDSVIRATSNLMTFLSTIDYIEASWVFYRYHFVFAVEVDMSSTRKLHYAHGIARVEDEMRKLDIYYDQPPTFLGFDVVEPNTNWSVINHASEWSSTVIMGNDYQLCASLENVRTLLEIYKNSTDPFKLPLDENRIYALYEVYQSSDTI